MAAEKSSDINLKVCHTAPLSDVDPPWVLAQTRPFSV